MSDADTIDEAALAAELEANVEGFAGFRSASRFNTGQSNPTWKIEADSATYVLRAKPPGRLLPRAHQVDREFRVMNALKGSGVPVPDVLFLSSEDSALGRMYFVMRFCEGRIFWNPALPELETSGDRAAIYDAMNRTLASLHSVDVAAAGLDDFGRQGGYVARQLRRWTQNYRAAETEKRPDMDRLVSWLEENCPAEDSATTLVHGDWRLDNMIFHLNDPSVLAVLDWELSTLGDPLSDLAYQCMAWRLPNDSGFRGMGGLDRAALGLPSEEAYVAAYCTRRGIGAIANWSYYMAFSFFRLAAILQGVYKRALDGNASNPEIAMRYGTAVPVLARMGADEVALT